MKKQLVALVFIFSLFSFLSCSSDDSSGDSNNVSGMEVPESTFNFTLDGENITINQFTAQRSGDFFLITGTGDNGINVQFRFHALGNYGTFSAFSTEDLDFLVESLAFASESTFQFDLLEVDESDQTIAGNFQGLLFEDEFVFEMGTAVEASGGFNIPYITVTPQISGLGFSASIDGEAWHGLSSGETSGVPVNSTPTNIFNHNETPYIIGLNIIPDSLTEGTFNFSPSSTFNNIIFERFDPTIDNEETRFSTTGVLVVSEVNPSNFGLIQIIGTFDLQAEDPITGEIISVESGMFNTLITL